MGKQPKTDSAWQVKTGLVVIAFFFVCVVRPQAAPDTLRIGGLSGADLSEQGQTYPILLALSGGGARGLSSIGLLQAFEERRITVAAVTGTSMGGIVGGLYACGHSPDALEEIIRSIDFSTLFTNTPARSSMFLTQRQERDRHLISLRFDGLRPHIPQGLTAGQRLTSLLTGLTAKANYRANGNFTRLPIPFKTITTDIVHGRMEVMSSGSLPDAMRATMAFPLAFTGVERNGMILMDGGMVAPIPVEQVKQMCDTVSYVVAVNTTSPLVEKEKLLTPVDIASQVTTIMTADQLNAQLEKADFVITPPLEDYTSADFHRKDSIIEIGYRAGLQAADSIIAMVTKRQRNIYYRIASIDCETDDSTLTDACRTALLGQSFNRLELVNRLKWIVTRNSLFDLSAIVEPVMLAEEEPDNRPVQAFQLSLVLHKNPVRAQTAITVDGNTMFDDSTLIAALGLADETITADGLRDGLDSMINLYHKRGYDLTNIRSADIDFAAKYIRIVVDEAIVRRIDVDQNRRTRDWVVRSYFPLGVGQPYSTKAASQGLTQIYSTDLFDRVSIVPLSDDSGAVVNISVDEKKYQQVRLGWHWDDEYQSEEFVELLDDNLFGVAMEYLAHAQYGRERQLYFGEFKANRIFRSYLSGQIRLYHDRIERALFDNEEQVIGVRGEYITGGTIRLGQHIARLGTLTGGFTLEEIELKDHRTKQKETFGLRSFTLESLVENFDRWPFPTTGKKHLLEIQAAGKFLGGDVEFTKLFTSLEAYVPIGEQLNYHPRISIGVSRSGLPVSEQFYTGGLHAFTGYRTHQLSGDKMLLINNELRLKLPLSLYIVARYDIGEVYTSADQIKLRNLRHGFGMSLALDSPIGPVEFGYGVADEDHNRWYFGAGLSF